MSSTNFCGPQSGLSKHDPSTPLAEKEAKIARLNDEIFTHKSRISVLQARLVSCLDTLDAIKNSNAAELTQESDSNTRLLKKLSSYIHMLKEVEDERDDLRNAVTALVEQVEKNSSDYSRWPRSRIYLPDPVYPTHTSTSLSSQVLTTDIGSHMNLIVTELKSQLRGVRESYQRLQKSAEIRIAELEAQVARRDTQLEYAIMFNDHHKQAALDPLFSASSSSNNNVHLSPHTITRTLHSKSLRDHLLAGEVTELQDKVDKAKNGSFGSSPIDRGQRPSSQAPSSYRSFANKEIQTGSPYEQRSSLSSSSLSFPRRNPKDLDDDRGLKVLRILDQQVHDAKMNLVELQTERDRLATFLRRSVELERENYPDNKGIDAFRAALSLEEQYIISQRTVNDLRAEVQRVKVSNQEENLRLMNQIVHLQNSLRLPTQGIQLFENPSDLLVSFSPLIPLSNPQHLSESPSN